MNQKKNTLTTMSTSVHILRSEEEYDAAIAEIEQLLDRDPSQGTEDYDRLELLALLVHHYESERHAIIAATPQEVVEFMLEQKKINRAALAPILGGNSRVAEFFSGIRPLTLKQIRLLRELLGIPADLLMGQENYV